ncbi:endonuclease domain-containing protein [Candidatus Gracilibacteria bacterium]|jgi:very-short-patch-repair endonuclease|nr:endonuclease domain-containing protein [Candidatus Gracilibacteria bacterium]
MNPEISKLSGCNRQIPRELLGRARELRKQQTSAEAILWECLRDRRFFKAKFRRQHNIGQYIVDFYCHAGLLAIEVDGAVHDAQQVKDADRDEWMQSHGLTVLRFRNDEVFDELEKVLGAIALYLPSP